MTRYFLDMNIPVYFCMQFGHPLEQKAEKFVKEKNKDIFLICDYIRNHNLPKWLNRQKIILFEFNQKIQNPSYELFSSKKSESLLAKDKILAKRLTLLYSQSSNKPQFAQDTNNIFNLLNRRVEIFLKNYIDETVIPEIDEKLRSCLFSWLNPNDSDARTIASAIQEHNNKELKIITADKKDWTKELLEEVHNDIGLKKVYPKLPTINYLQDL